MHPKSAKILKCPEAFTFLSNLPDDINFPYMPLNFKPPKPEIKDGWNYSVETNYIGQFIFKKNDLTYLITLMNGSEKKILAISYCDKIGSSIRHYNNNEYVFTSLYPSQYLIIPQDLLANTIKYAKENPGLISFI